MKGKFAKCWIHKCFCLKISFKSHQGVFNNVIVEWLFSIEGVCAVSLFFSWVTGVVAEGGTIWSLIKRASRLGLALVVVCILLSIFILVFVAVDHQIFKKEKKPRWAVAEVKTGKLRPFAKVAAGLLPICTSSAVLQYRLGIQSLESAGGVCKQNTLAFLVYESGEVQLPWGALWYSVIACVQLAVSIGLLRGPLRKPVVPLAMDLVEIQLEHRRTLHEERKTLYEEQRKTLNEEQRKTLHQEQRRTQHEQVPSPRLPTRPSVPPSAPLAPWPSRPWTPHKGLGKGGKGPTSSRPGQAMYPPPPASWGGPRDSHQEDIPDLELLPVAREVQAHLDRSEEVLTKQTEAHEEAEAKLSEARLIATEEEVKLLLDAVQESEQSLRPKEVQADRYDLSDPLALARFLQDADIRLVRAKYLAELVLAQQPLPRRQEAESLKFTSGGITQTALVTHEEVQEWATGSRKAIMCSISHAWETREHPDPCRYQLEHIVSHTALFDAAFEADVWVFYDYTSLFQYERDPNSHEERSFRKAMANMHMMYCHEYNLTFRIEGLTPEDTWNAMKANENELVPVWDQESKTVKARPLKSLVENRNLYLERGWCMAEVEWSSLRRVNLQHQRIDKPKAGENSYKSRKDQNLNGKIPMTPGRFKAAMEKSKFTHRSDAATVINLQEKIYFEKVTACEELILEGLPGTEVAALAATLPDFKNLKTMKVSNFECGKAEAKALGEAGDRCWSCGSFRKSTGMEALAEALKVNKTLTNIDLSRNGIGIKGAKAWCLGRGSALAEALKVNKTLTNIDLINNWIGKEGAKALAEALKVNMTVTNIDLRLNGIGKEGAEAWCLARGSAAPGLETALAEALKVNKTVANISLEYSSGVVVRQLLAERRQPQAETASDVGNWRDQEIDRHPFEMPIRLQAGQLSYSCCDWSLSPVSSVELLDQTKHNVLGIFPFPGLIPSPRLSDGVCGTEVRQPVMKV
eukprot:symbB.v1.2.037370.t1/scaffold5500.1/size26397/1